MTARLHPAVRPRAQDITRFYRGRSMAGTFRLGDALILEDVSLAQVRAGDVVVFRGIDPEGKENLIVHRVQAVLSHGLVTQGDNNPCVDTILVTAESLVGRVTHIRREGRILPVHGGRRGLWQARLRRAGKRWRRRGEGIVRRVGRRPYRLLRKSGLAARLWRPSIIRLALTVGEEKTVKYICNGQTIAQWWPERGQFRCRRPHDLILSRPARRTTAIPPDTPPRAKVPSARTGP